MQMIWWINWNFFSFFFWTDLVSRMIASTFLIFFVAFFVLIALPSVSSFPPPSVSLPSPFTALLSTLRKKKSFWLKDCSSFVRGVWAVYLSGKFGFLIAESLNLHTPSVDWKTTWLQATLSDQYSEAFWHSRIS